MINPDALIEDDGQYSDDTAESSSGRITYTVRRSDKEVTQGPGGRHGLEREAGDLYPLEVPRAAARVAHIGRSTRRPR